MARAMIVGLAIGAIGILLLLSASGFGAPGGAVGGPSAISSSTVTPQASPPPNPFFTGMAASLALGAPNLTTTWTGSPLNGSSFVPDPELACVDPSGNVWVPDFGGSRVLEFKPPFSFKESASVVLGQATNSSSGPNNTARTLDHPAACTTDAHGDVWVSDFYSSRVLEYVPPFTTGMAASIVLGQSNFVGDFSGISAHNFSEPAGMAFDPQGDLWIADDDNDRVLEFVPPFTTGMNASLVLGQTDFTSNTFDTTASNLSVPLDVDYSNGVLWVADQGNSRVVGFSAPFTDGEGATYLLGQSSFTGFGATGPGAIFGADSVATDANGDLWVSEFNSNRVVEFLPPFTTFENASVAIGQKSLITTTVGTNATTLDNPLGAVIAPNGALWVSDATNNRVLEYVPSVYHVSFTAAGLPSGKAWSVVFGGTSYPATGPNVTVPEENGSYTWNVPTISGYTVSASNGTAVVRGANVTITLTVTQVTYTVLFIALGLPAASNWSVTLDGVTHKSLTNASISFTVANGTYPYSVANVSGYNISAKVGSVAVAGSGSNVGIGFALLPTSSGSSSSSSPLSTTESLLLIVVALVVGLLVGILVGRRRKGGAATPAQWSPPAGSAAPPPPPPPSGGSPPPGAMG